MAMYEMKMSSTKRSRRSGQTLVIAILVLGVLLILGIAFAGIISRNITETGRSARRTVASDLATAGIKYAHNQMLNSASGADWRPDATALTAVGGVTKDPDASFLRPGSGFPVEIDPVNRPGFFITDLGGPDYLGAYSRVGFDRGRALVRVRYSPSAYDQFSAATGALRELGRAKGHIVIESVGRAGALDDQGRIDPSQLLTESLRVTGFANGNAVRDGVGQLKAANNTITNSRTMIAFASVGFLESGRFISNIYELNRPAEIGFPTAGGAGLFTDQTNVGARYEGVNVATGINFGSNNSGASSIPVDQGRWDLLPGGASIYSNAPLEVHGVNRLVINRSLGENVTAVGGIKPANSSAELILSLFKLNNATGNWDELNTGAGDPVTSPVTLTGNQMSSDNPNYTTVSGVLQDGRDAQDAQGYIRTTKRKDPPSITATNPQNGLNRYLELTQRTGRLNAAGDLIGQFGHGEGVYVDSNERGNRRGSDAGKGFDPQKSMPNDWLNPNNATSQGWQGPYYIPNAPHVQLLPDGFEIRRDNRSEKAFWVDPNGASSGSTYARYWVRNVGGVNFIVNNIANPAFDPLTGNFATEGQIFNGVLMFEGDVRVRGVIPTDQQLTLVSMGSIYVEGSITKGVFEPWAGAMLTRPSRSMLALLAKDYVTVNTTMFFGPKVGESPRPKSTNPVPNTPNPIELDPSTDIVMSTEFVLNPVGNNPSTWQPFATGYAAADGTGVLPSWMIASVSGDDNGPAFLGLEISSQVFRDPTPATGSYLFPTDMNFFLNSVLTNGAAAAYPAPVPTNIPEYGLTDPTVNAYPKFESWAMPIFNPTAGAFAAYNPLARKLEATGANPFGGFDLATQHPTDFRFFLNPVGAQPSKNVLMARTAITPADVRIEAVMYAQNGSFFVIPGQWFNTNPDDLRTSFEQNYTPADNTDDLATAALDYGGGVNLDTAQQRRYERYGASPEMPFYGEPLAVRISIIGSIAENMPAPMSMQAEWLKKWGWMPRRIGGTGRVLPTAHVPGGVLAGQLTVPNMILNYDPVLATAAVPQNDTPTAPLEAIRLDSVGRILPPAPRLPVSPTLAYFGDINP
ncbi:hypothetical protein CCB80_12010 [Armatimonadetes bacterium Uphvl-Ar1]|nr:hypothetical protein CCB80_12010 [Armatimonadetes bacterium Uphvl-Ar1]